MSVLIVDDHPAVRDLLDRVLTNRGLHTTAVGTARHALRVLREAEFELVILDLSLTDEDGLEMLRQIRFEFPPVAWRNNVFDV